MREGRGGVAVLWRRIVAVEKRGKRNEGCGGRDVVTLVSAADPILVLREGGYIYGANLPRPADGANERDGGR